MTIFKYMYKIFFIAVFFVLCSMTGFFAPQVSADYASLRTDYSQKLTEYNTALSNYQIAKNTYSTYQTLASLTKALDAAKVYLQNRDDLIIKHFEMLDTKIDNVSYKKIVNDEISFFQNHLNLIPAVATLKDVTSVAKKSEEEIVLANIKSKQILGQILINKINVLKTDYEDISVQLEAYVINLKSQPTFSKEKIDKLERWLVEVKNKKNLCETNLEKVSTKLNSFKKESMDLERDFNEVRINIIQANLYLKEGTNYMKEILAEIKYQ